MEFQEFKTVIGRLTVYFDRKMPSEAAIALWFEQSKDIPAGAIHSIYSQITRQDTFPKNIGNSFRDAWGVFKSANPGKIIQSYGQCHECGGSGIYFGKKDGIKFVFGCGSCQNYQKHFSRNTTTVAIATIPALISRGYEVTAR